MLFFFRLSVIPKSRARAGVRDGNIDCRENRRYAAVAHSEERAICNRHVVGSSPISSSISRRAHFLPLREWPSRENESQNGKRAAVRQLMRASGILRRMARPCRINRTCSRALPSRLRAPAAIDIVSHRVEAGTRQLSKRSRSEHRGLLRRTAALFFVSVLA